MARSAGAVMKRVVRVDFVGAHADGACRIVVRLVARRGSREIGAGHSDYEIGRLVVMDSPDVEITRRRLVAASDPIELHLVPARVARPRASSASCWLCSARSSQPLAGKRSIGSWRTQMAPGIFTASVICCPTITVAVTAVPVAGLTALTAMVVGVLSFRCTARRCSLWPGCRRRRQAGKGMDYSAARSRPWSSHRKFRRPWRW